MEKHLFLIDLDGTLLKDSSKNIIHKKDIEAVKRATKEGHVVCIATGRPWRASEKAYHTLGLKTVIANYNGAQIHNPTDYSFNPVISYMNLNDVMYILGDNKLKKCISNLAIEGPGWVMLKKRDKDLERVFGFKDAAKLRVGIDFHKLPLKPTGVILDTKPGVKILELKDYLQRTYGDLVEFSSWSKGSGLTPVFDMTNVGITKAKAMSLISRYYDIPAHRTIAIGDGYNDVPMMEVAEYSVVMDQADNSIKNHATFVTNSNQKAGVAEFINKFLDNNDFRKELRKKRKIIANQSLQMVASH